MKKLFFPALLVLITSLCACKKLAQLTQFDMRYNCEATIQSGATTALPFDIFTPDVTTQSESEFQGHNTAKKLVQSIKLKQMKLTIKSPDGRTFDFLKNIDLYISADGEEEVLIASKHDIPDNIGTELLLEPGTSDLKAYITKDKYKLKLKVTTDKIINEDVTINIGSTFRVDANILGL